MAVSDHLGGLWRGRRQSPGFALETRATFAVTRYIARQHLDGDVATEQPIARAIHITDAAAPSAAVTS